MFDDDFEPQKKGAQLKNLEPMSTDELGIYIHQMEVEILRVKEEIKKKKAVLEAAGSVFKS